MPLNTMRRPNRYRSSRRGLSGGRGGASFGRAPGILPLPAQGAVAGTPAADGPATVNPPPNAQAPAANKMAMQTVKTLTAPGQPYADPTRPATAQIPMPPFPGAEFAGSNADMSFTFWRDPVTGKLRTFNGMQELASASNPQPGTQAPAATGPAAGAPAAGTRPAAGAPAAGTPISSPAAGVPGPAPAAGAPPPAPAPVAAPAPPPPSWGPAPPANTQPNPAVTPIPGPVGAIPGMPWTGTADGSGGATNIRATGTFVNHQQPGGPMQAISLANGMSAAEFARRLAPYALSFDKGGIIPEEVIGVGSETGTIYQIAGSGPERVLPNDISDAPLTKPGY